MRRAVAVAVALSCLLAACDDEGAEEQPVVEAVQPNSRDEGIQATGLLGGSRVAISRGSPIVTLGDCDPNDGVDEDLCILARTIDGLNVTLVIENPAVLEPGATLDASIACAGLCDDVTEGAVVQVRLDDRSLLVERGTITVAEAGPRWVADFDLQLAFGDELRGRFDVAPSE